MSLALLQDEFEAAFRAHFSQLRADRLAAFPALVEAISYSTKAGGKRVRALLALGACQACGGDRQAALQVAIAIEYLHCYSLIHDDLPALDNDDMRRGRPSNHKQYGEAMAILAGDALQSLCFVTLARIDTPNQGAIVQEISRAALAMVGGQSLDIAATQANTDSTALERIHRNKTGALIVASLVGGGLCGNPTPDQRQALVAMGENIGLAFQITDDLLEQSQTSDSLGKSNASDRRNAQPTYVTVMGAKQSQQRIAACHSHTLQALGLFDADRAQVLSWLCDFLHQRRS